MGDKRSIIFKNRLSELERLRIAVEEFAEARSLPSKTAFEINLCLDELLTNVISYAYQDEEEHEIVLTMVCENGRIILTLEDDGAPFDPLERAEPEVAKPADEREIGGLGIHFVRKMMDRVEYRRDSDRNIVTLTKKTDSDSQSTE